MAKRFTDTLHTVNPPAVVKKSLTTEQVYDVTASGYSHAGASHTKNAFKGFTGESICPKLDIDYNNRELRSRSRMMMMSSPVASSAIRTMRTNVVGVGIVPKPRIEADIIGCTPDEAFLIQKQIEREWNLWAKDKWSCDATGVNDFYAIQQLAYTAYRASGDCFVLFKWEQDTARSPYSLRLHLIEADRVSTPTMYPQIYQTVHYSVTEGENPYNGNPIYDGIEVNKNTGRVEAYWVCNSYPYDYTAIDSREWVRVEAVGGDTGLPNILQLMESERPEQYRGVPMLAPVMERILQLNRYGESVVATAVLHAKQTMVIETLADPTMSPFGADGKPIKQASTRARDIAIGNGAVNVLKAGEKMNAFKPEQPTGTYGNYMDAVGKEIGAGLEIPRGQLMKDFNSSYSATRGELLEFQKYVKMNQQWFIADFCQPVYERWFTEAVARGRIKATGFFRDPVIRQAYLNCEWIVPSFGQIDPTKEVQALEIAVRNGWTTNEASARQYNGSDFYHNAMQLKRENEVLPKQQLSINQQQYIDNNPDDVDNYDKEDNTDE